MRLKEAEKRAKAFIIEKYNSYETSLTLLTGVGSHSKGGVSVIRNAVPSWLKSDEIRDLIDSFKLMKQQQGYKIILNKPSQINLNNIKPNQDPRALIRKALLEVMKNGEDRLKIKTHDNSIAAKLTIYLAQNNSTPYGNILPVSYEFFPGEIRINLEDNKSEEDSAESDDNSATSSTNTQPSSSSSSTASTQSTNSNFKASQKSKASSKSPKARETLSAKGKARAAQSARDKAKNAAVKAAKTKAAQSAKDKARATQSASDKAKTTAVKADKKAKARAAQSARDKARAAKVKAAQQAKEKARATQSANAITKANALQIRTKQSQQAPDNEAQSIDVLNRILQKNYDNN